VDAYKAKIGGSPNSGKGMLMLNINSRAKKEREGKSAGVVSLPRKSVVCSPLGAKNKKGKPGLENISYWEMVNYNVAGAMGTKGKGRKRSGSTPDTTHLAGESKAAN